MAGVGLENLLHENIKPSREPAGWLEQAVLTRVLSGKAVYSFETLDNGEPERR